MSTALGLRQLGMRARCFPGPHRASDIAAWRAQQSGVVVLELPVTKASEPLADLRPVGRLRFVNSGCKPISERALIELIEIDYNVVPGVVDTAGPAGGSGQPLWRAYGDVEGFFAGRIRRTDDEAREERELSRVTGECGRIGLVLNAPQRSSHAAILPHQTPLIAALGTGEDPPATEVLRMCTSVATSSTQARSEPLDSRS